MPNKIDVTGRLKVGDIVKVINAIMNPTFYEVYKIEGNKAFTRFRIFHVNIYRNECVFEYGKKSYGFWDNSYVLSNKEEAKKANAIIK